DLEELEFVSFFKSVYEFYQLRSYEICRSSAYPAYLDYTSDFSSFTQERESGREMGRERER
ncbi:hypothetical protein J6590_103748, partial [Homalodisca vitripennis]